MWDEDSKIFELFSRKGARDCLPFTLTRAPRLHSKRTNLSSTVIKYRLELLRMKGLLFRAFITFEGWFHDDALYSRFVMCRNSRGVMQHLGPNITSRAVKDLIRIGSKYDRKSMRLETFSYLFQSQENLVLNPASSSLSRRQILGYMPRWFLDSFLRLYKVNLMLSIHFKVYFS